MSGFLSVAKQQVVDVRSFLRDAAGGNSIKYSAEKGKKHTIYIPYTVQSVVNPDTGETSEVKTIIAIRGDVHEWSTADGKYKSSICLKDKIRKAEDGTLLNDGTCPFCDRVSDAWDIYRYRKELEESTCQLTGEDRKKHLEKTLGSFAEERKAKDARPHIYILVVKYRVDDANKPIIGDDGLPEYDLKVMKMSASRVEKIDQQVTNAGSELPGSQLVFEYPSVDDRRLLVSQSTVSPVFDAGSFTTKYPALLEKIKQDVSKFQWEGIEKAFPEWEGMTTETAKATTDAMFEQWDSYKKEILTNPQAKYLEYVVEAPKTAPSITAPGVAGAIPVVPGAAPVPTIPPVAPATEAVQMPTATAPTAPIPEAPVPPVAPAPDVNGVFAGPTPSVTI